MYKNINEIKQKSEYCLNCKTKPCSQKGCPLENDIPVFIEKIKQEKYEEAYKILSKNTVLTAICGRICPHEKQCQGSCVRGIKGEPVQIGNMEAFIGDKSILENWKLEKEADKNEKIAIVGGGPSGITAAAFLAKKGYKVTIYEKYDKLGGLLIHGIPEFRLPRDVIQNTINKILELGIDVKYNMELGKDFTIEELEREYDAILLSFGANISSKMNIEGEDIDGVYGGNELLEHNLHPDYMGKKVAVIGGGNTAVDVARTIKRKGAKSVTIIYRRARKQMPAENKEVEEAIQEGVEFLFQNNIVKIIPEENKVSKIECIKTELVKQEGDREKPINIEGSNYIIDMDYVVMALGSEPEKLVLQNLGLELNKWGYIKIDEKNRTSREKVFASGDIAGEKKTVAWAARSGRNAAEKICEYLNKK